MSAQPNEMPIGEAMACELLSHAMLVARSGRDVVVRVFEKKSGNELKYVALPAVDAMRLGARMIQAAIHADPSLLKEFDQIIATARAGDGRPLRVVGDTAEVAR